MSKVVGPFQKSSYSGQNGDCVEVAQTSTNARAVRDSKVQDGPLLILSAPSWARFLRALK
ncbi:MULTISPECIES: DUF397 domain-containing protein [unclassified Streptomyces]|uniref:DUF397 domain-containing protein n=1 Tax=unclassified Streptomyces TaxID=2593676 RepID=UPI0038115BD0